MTKLNLLNAWPYWDDRLGEGLQDPLIGGVRLLIDSGAFTAWKAGTALKLEDYFAFLDRLPFKPWRHFMLDVIGDPAATWRNYQASLDAGYHPIPIFTRGEEASRLDHFYETSDLVAVGGLVGTRYNRGFVNGIMERTQGRRIHWLGFTDQDFLLHHRPFSADSSGWSKGLRWGQLDIYLGKGRWHRLFRKDTKSPIPDAACAALRRMEIDPRLFSDAQQWVNTDKGLTALEIITYRSWALYQHELEERTGVRLFLASAGYRQGLLIAHGRKFWVERGVIPLPKEDTDDAGS